MLAERLLLSSRTRTHLSELGLLSLRQKQTRTSRANSPPPDPSFCSTHFSFFCSHQHPFCNNCPEQKERKRTQVTRRLWVPELCGDDCQSVVEWDDESCVSKRQVKHVLPSLALDREPGGDRVVAWNFKSGDQQPDSPATQPLVHHESEDPVHQPYLGHKDGRSTR